MTRALLIRHGQSTWNAVGRWQGQQDPPLSTVGRVQALHAASGLGALDAIVASDLQRASETATIIADKLGCGPVTEDPRLRERCAGEWEGLTRDEIEVRFPGYLDAGRRPPGWEPGDVLVARVVEALQAIHDATPDGHVLVVTHGGVVYALEARFGLPWERLANASGRWFDLGPDGALALGARVVLVDKDEETTSDVD